MCGILAYYCDDNIDNLTIYNFMNMLNRLQHRGQDGFGLFFNNKSIVYKGLIKTYLKSNPIFIKNKIKDKCILGHTRYITSGDKGNNVYQPIKSNCKFGNFSLIYNGNLSIEKYSYLFTKKINVDTEMIIEFIKKDSLNRNSFKDVLINLINLFDRAYSIIISINNELYCLRDKYGVRPLSYFYTIDNIIFTSETCITDNSKTKYSYKEVQNGEIIHVSKFRCNSIYNSLVKYNAQCLFEYIYFMNENSIWNDIKVGKFRKNMGYLMANYEENKDIFYNRKNYLVIGIPNTGILSAREYASQLGIEYKQAIIKNTNIQRTFILKDNTERDKVSKNKYIYNEELLTDRNLIIVDDSIVRGITIKNIITKLKTYTDREIHIKIACPQIKDTCEYGIDIPTKKELLLNNIEDLDELTKHLECSSVSFVKIENILEKINRKGMCTGCFNSDYKNKNLDW